MDKNLEHSGTPAKLDEVIAAYLQAVERGEKPDRAEWLRRNPDVAEGLTAFFADQARFERVAAPLKNAIADAPTITPNPSPAVTLQSGASSVGLGAPRKVRYFGDYELLDEIARGGMGVVYKARQVSLNRIVALKMILSGALAGPDDVKRFRTEAEAAGSLDHPNIVPIYEVGEHEGSQYFSMKLVEGGSLSKEIPTLLKQPKAAAKLLAAVARAVHYAHQRGILHRDLKPANILLDKHGQPHVTDFGLAKRVADDSGLTQTGAVVGTPAYMAPEQASGKARHVTTSADVYSLGAVFYEMLTGQAPFKADTVLGTLMKVRNEEPVPPSRINPTLDRDLETICLKCLEKEPAIRYASAEALADDLDRWLRGEPIAARPATTGEKVIKWAKRRPAVAALVAVSALALAGLIGGGAWYNTRLVAALRGSQQQLAESLVSQGDALCLAGRFAESTSRYDEARRIAMELGDPALPAESGLFEAYEHAALPLQTFHGLTSGPSSVAFSPDGKHALSGPYGKTLKLWDVMTGREVGTFSGSGEQIIGLAFSPDNKQALAVTHEGVTVWEVATGQNVRTFGRHNLQKQFRPTIIEDTGKSYQISSHVSEMAFSPDGKLALSASDAGPLKLWDVASGQELRTLGYGAHLAFSKDGNLALSAMRETLVLWDVATGQKVRTFSGHTAWVSSVAFSPAGNLALSASRDGILKLWDVSTGREVRTFKGHALWVRKVAFSPDGNMALSGSDDKTLKLWEVATGKELQTFSGHSASVTSLVFSPDSRLVLSGGEDTTVRLWSLSARREVLAFPRSEYIYHLALSPDGRLALSTYGDTTFELWDAATGFQLRTFAAPKYIYRLAFSPNGKLALSTSSDKTLKLWDLATGNEWRTLSGHKDIIRSIAFSPDGSLVASASDDQTLKLWDVATGRETRSFSCSQRFASFYPDGKLALLDGKSLKLVDVATGNAVRTFSAETWNVVFSQNGKFALSATGNTVQLWDLSGGRKARTFSGGHAQAVMSVALSPDGRLVFSGSNDTTVKLWDVTTGRELRTISDASPYIALSADGMAMLHSRSNQMLQLRDFSRPARYREFNALLPKASEAILKDENDAEALKTFGEWYAFRGVNDWAVEMLEKARINGADISLLTLARCYWLLSEDEHEPKDKRPARRAAAAAEFQKEIARVKAQPVPQDPKAKFACEQEEHYLNLCLQAVQKTPPDPVKPADAK